MREMASGSRDSFSVAEGDVVVDAEDADGGPVVVADVDGGGLENLSVLRLGQVAQVVLKLLPVAPQGLQHHV